MPSTRIITREGGPQEAIEEGKSRLLVDYGSRGQLAEAIITILRDPKRARQMGELARKRIEQDFTWEAVAKRVNGAYCEVLGR